MSVTRYKIGTYLIGIFFSFAKFAYGKDKKKTPHHRRMSPRVKTANENDFENRETTERQRNEIARKYYDDSTTRRQHTRGPVSVCASAECASCVRASRTCADYIARSLSLSYTIPTSTAHSTRTSSVVWRVRGGGRCVENRLKTPHRLSAQ